MQAKEKGKKRTSMRKVISLIIVFISLTSFAQDNLDTLEIYYGQRKYYKKDLFPKIYGCIKTRLIVFRKNNPDAYYIIRSKKNDFVSGEGIFIDSGLHGKWVYYDEKGNIIEITQYDHGELDGEQTFFNEDGSIDCTLTWEKGEIVQEECFDEQGNSDVINH